MSESFTVGSRWEAQGRFQWTPRKRRVCSKIEPFPDADAFDTEAHEKIKEILNEMGKKMRNLVKEEAKNGAAFLAIKAFARDQSTFLPPQGELFLPAVKLQWQGDRKYFEPQELQGRFGSAPSHHQRQL